MKVLITGASGLLGRPIMRQFGDHADFRVVGTAFSRGGDGLTKLDLCDSDAVNAFVRTERPDVIVHSAAERRPDISETDMAATARLNIEATRQLAELAGELGFAILHISTDYVFDGENPPYYPDSKTNPLNYYGTSKRDAEDAVRSSVERHWILRIPMLYGQVEHLRESPVTTLADMILSGGDEPIKLDDLAVRYPTLTDDVALVCRQIVERDIDRGSLHGTLHWSGNEAMTKFAMGKVIAESLSLSKANLLADPNPPQTVPRPRDSHLDCTVLENAGIGRRSPFRESITAILKPYAAKSA